MRKLVDRLIYLVRREELNIIDVEMFVLFRLLLTRACALIRGNIYLMIHRGKLGFLFKGRNTRIIASKFVHLGRGVTLKDNVIIDANRADFIKLGNNVSLGRNVVLDSGASLLSSKGNLTVGTNSGFSEGCLVAIRGRVNIGNDVIFGPGVSVFSENHGMKICPTPFRMQPCDSLEVTVESNVWIGAGTIILGGSYIEKDSVVAAGSVVRGRLESGYIYGGVPAKIIKKLH